MANTVYYAAVMAGDQRSLKSRLGRIEGAMAMKAEGRRINTITFLTLTMAQEVF